MAEGSLEAAKAFVKGYSTASTKKRAEILSQLSAVTKDIPGPVAKLTINALCNTLLIYNDGHSRSCVRNLLDSLCSVHGTLALDALSTSLKSLEPAFRNSTTLGKNALTAVTWSCVLIGRLEKLSEEAIQSQAVFVSAAVSGYKKSVTKKLNSLWKSKPSLSQETLTILLSSSPSIEKLPLLALVLGFIAKPTEKYEAVLGSYSKVVLSSRSKPLQPHLVNSTGIFKHATHDNFTALLLPGVLKCLLRNPDELLEAVATMMTALPIDLSQYCKDILKNTIAHLSSNNEATRKDALCLVQALASQTSDSGPVKDMVKQLFTALKGSPGGKLSVADHRSSVLSAIEALAISPLSAGGKREVAIAVAEALVAHIKQEVNTGSAVKAVSVLAIYCSSLTPDTPKIITDQIKNGLSGKATAPSLRSEYIRCLQAICIGDIKHPELLSLVETNLGKLTASSQPVAMEEALIACHCLVEASRPGGIPSCVWAVAGKFAEQLNSSKVVSSLSQTGLESLVYISSALLTAEQDNLTSPREWLAGMVRVLTTPYWRVRTTACEAITKAVEFNGDYAYTLLDTIEAMASKDELGSKMLMSALLCLTTPSCPAPNEIAVRTFLISHHPSIDSQNLWCKILRKLSLSPRDLISDQIDRLLSLILSSLPSLTASRALDSVLKLHPSVVSGGLVKELCLLLRSADLRLVTADSVEIMNTKDGQLWHPAMNQELQAVAAGVVDLANLKKSTKAYSFEDQKWDAEMRLEAQRKKKQQGGTGDIRTEIKKSKLSDKRKEAFEAQLDHEEATRKTLKEINSKLSNLVAALRLARGGPLCSQTPVLCEVLLECLDNPLAGPHCRELWKILVESVFSGWDNTTKPPVFIPFLFGETSLKVLLSKDLGPSFIKLLHCLEHYHSTDSGAHVLTLPLLSIVVSCECDWELKEGTVTILCKAVQQHTSNSTGLQDFPGEGTLKLLSQVISMKDDAPRAKKLKESCVGAYVSLLPRVSIPSDISESLLHSSALLRATVLEGLCALDACKLPDNNQFIVSVLIARHDLEQENRELADNLWEDGSYGNKLTLELMPLLVEQAASSKLHLHSSVAAASGIWLAVHGSQANEYLDQLKTLFKAKKTAPPPTKDKFGREVFIEYKDPWESRVGLAKAMEPVVKLLGSESALGFLKFIIPDALDDGNAEAHKAVMSAARVAIAAHGESLAGELMDHFDKCLQSVADSVAADLVRQSIVVLMGTLAQHMDKSNPKVKSVVHLLLATLDTPSQSVQEAIASCLPPLAPVVKDNGQEIITKLLDKLLEAPSFSQRKGAAYGIAGLVKGLTIPTLKQYNIMTTLKDAIKNKKNYKHREGALFAYECLCSMLGRLFEPYVVQLLPDLLLCFGDGNQYVREATDHTSRTIMGNLSSHGVKLILPSLLKALDEDSWRTKAGSAELLGAMAFCAPKQLSSCLPSIVPKLIVVLADSHAKVHQAGWQALKQIGSVIKNPEIQALVPTLLDALAEPSTKSQVCLQKLLDTEFVHVVDSPSLALIMPTLKCTLEIRSTDTKKMAAQIIGNMYSLTDKKDLAPYLPDVLPGLKTSLVDPVPEVRSTCAKALGAMVRGIGDEGLNELVPWLQSTLVSEASSVDRSGAAQGLSEVLFARGVDFLSGLMPQFVAACTDQNNPTSVRDGYLMLFVYLPVTFGEGFLQFIADVIPCILKGLADESEFVRETALQAGGTIVNRYADSAVELFLPQLEAGLFDDNWRIRCSSVQLLGDLLFKISGLSGKMSTESAEDDNFGTEEARQTLLHILGRERRDRVLAGLYMGRSDVAVQVRQTALHVWKVVVTNTARTLKEILSTLVQLLLSCLASHSHDKRTIAARTLGDLVRKLGERVLPEVIPMLEAGLSSADSERRQGVCIGLSEIIQYTSRENVLLYLDSLVPTARSALCDHDQEVRAAAAKTFDSLYATIGPRVLDEVLSPLLADLGSHDKSEIALDGLKQVMAVRSSVVLPHIVPQLVQPPVNTEALALLSTVAGDSLHKHLDRIIPALIVSMTDDNVDSCYGVVLSVVSEPGPDILLEQLFKAARDNKLETRSSAMKLLSQYCEQSAADLSEHVPQLIVFATEALNDPSDTVCENAWRALDATVKRVSPKELPHYTGYLRKALRTVTSNLLGEELHGFALKGITPALAILKEGLISGSPDEKEEAARVLVELINLASTKTLSTGKIVMLIAGPLIRVLGDRYGWHVKVATLEALVQLVRKVGSAAKSFIPQLQTSYLKALNDPNKPVRLQAVTGLTELLPLSVRVDPVVNELHNGIKKSEDPSLRSTLLLALKGVLNSAGAKVSSKHKTDLTSTLIQLQSTAVEDHRLEAAHCLGILASLLPDSELETLLSSSLLYLDSSTDWACLQAKATALATAIPLCYDKMVDLGLAASLSDTVVSLACSDRIPVAVSGLNCLASLFNQSPDHNQLMLGAVKESMVHTSIDVRVAGCDLCAAISSPTDTVLTTFLPSLLQSARDKNTAVKAAAEKAVGNLVQDDQHLKHCVDLLDALDGSKLEDTYKKVQARIAKDS